MKQFSFISCVIILVLFFSNISICYGLERNIAKGFSGNYYFGEKSGSKLTKAADLTYWNFREIHSSWLNDNYINQYNADIARHLMENLDAALQKIWELINNSSLSDEVKDIFNKKANKRDIDIIFDLKEIMGSSQKVNNPLLNDESRDSILLNDVYLAILLNHICPK